MTTEDAQSIKLPTPLLVRAAEVADEWNARDGVTIWSRAAVIRCVLTRGLAPGGHHDHPTTTPRPPHDHQAPKETRAPARKRASRAAASAGGNKNTSVVSPELASGAATPPPPTADLQENQASATPARAVRAHAYEPSVEVPASAAGTPRSGTMEIPDPTPERPPPRALRVIDGGAGDEPTYAPLSPDEEAAIMAEAIAKQDRLRAAHQADLAEKAEKRRLAGEAWKANEARKQAELDAYYERNPNGRGVPT